MKCFETIRVKDGELFHIDYHNQRVQKTLKELFGLKKEVFLEDLITPPKRGLYRCKVIYDQKIQSIRFYPYTPKKFQTFKLVNANINYRYKYLDRSAIDNLLTKEADEIIIIKDGLITDTSIANIAFFYKQEWITPKTPLLEGTTRRRYIDRGIVKGAEILAKDIKKFDTIALMNAMIDFVILKEFTIKEEYAL